jgi:hypothetical protein
MDQGRKRARMSDDPSGQLHCTPMLGALTLHWNNPKYGVIKARFLHANILSQNCARLGHARSGIFSSPLLDRKFYRTAVLIVARLFACSESQIIRFPGAPTSLRPALHWMDLNNQFHVPKCLPPIRKSPNSLWIEVLCYTDSDLV